MLLIVCLFAARRLLVGLRRALVLFRFAFAFGFDMFMPGMFCMSGPCGLALLGDESINAAMITALKIAIRMKTLKIDDSIVPPVGTARTNKVTRTRTQKHTPTQKSATILKGN
jgi:hypothetical protein